jgi:NADH-quinone oxidoreductase subunit N
MQNNLAFELHQALPEILLAISAITLVLIDLSKPTRRRASLLAWVALSGTFFALIATLNLAGNDGQYFYGMLVVDNFGIFFRGLFALGTAITILTSRDYWDSSAVHLGEYYALLLLSNLGLNFMVSSYELIVIFLGLEILSVSSYILLGMRRGALKSNESSLKYFLLGSFSSAFLLYGIALAYGAAQTTNVQKISTTIFSFPGNDLILLASGLLLVGLGFKASLAPFHVWTPDVYEGAPSPITGYMSVGPKAAAFAVLSRWFLEAVPLQTPHWQLLLWIIAALTMTLGNVAALVQTNIKRLLAYSSISHAGYALIALVAGEPDGTAGLLSYMAAYTLTNLGAFAIVSALAREKEKRVYLSDYAGLSLRSPFLSASLSIFLLSLAGIPLTVGFMVKFYVFRAALEAHLVWLVIIAVLNSAISVYYYSKVIVYMYMHDDNQDANIAAGRRWINCAVALTLGGVIFLGIFPEILWKLSKISTLNAH